MLVFIMNLMWRVRATGNRGLLPSHTHQRHIFHAKQDAVDESGEVFGGAES